MKEKIHYVIEAVLGIAVIVLFVLFFSNNKKTNFSPTASLDSNAISHDVLPMAYIDVDSLMQKYTYSIELNEQITRKYENSRANLTEKLRKLQSEVADFQRKMETNSFLTQERAQSEQQRLIKKQDDLQKLEAQLSQELGEEQMRMNEDLRKTIISQLKEFNKGRGYHIVYGKVNDNILFADDTYNITREVIEFLNKNHEASSTEKVSTLTPPPAKTE
jgi:outer membrane protein